MATRRDRTPRDWRLTPFAEPPLCLSEPYLNGAQSRTIGLDETQFLHQYCRSKLGWLITMPAGL